MSKPLSPRLTKVAEADFPTEFGVFRIFGFEAPAGNGTEEAVVLKMGDFTDGAPPLVRIHSQCLTGDVFHKLRAYELQDQGADTIEANEQLGFDSDLRNYRLPGAILQFFGLKAVRLMSNNPEKVEAVEKAGVQVVERVPCLADVVDTRLAYLRTKREKMGHLLEFDDL